MRCEFCNLDKPAPCRTAVAAQKCTPGEVEPVKALFLRSVVDRGSKADRLAGHHIAKGLGPTAVMVDELKHGEDGVVVVMALPGKFRMLDYDTWSPAQSALDKGMRVYEVYRDDGLVVAVDRIDPSRCLSQRASERVADLAAYLKGDQ